MNTDEKYKEIVESRKVANGEGENPSGVKTDPPAKEDVNPESKTPDSQHQKVEDKDDKSTTNPKHEPTLEEKQQHAIAKMRSDFNRDIAALRKENESLRSQLIGGNKPNQGKTRKDFKSDEEYGQYLRSQIHNSIKDDVIKEIRQAEGIESKQREFKERLSKNLDGIQKGLSEKVFKDLEDPYSEMSAILNDENAAPIIAAVLGNRGADFLALMQAKPEIFQDLLGLPEKKMEYRLYALEDQIEAKYAQFTARQRANEEKQERAASLPTAGSFGTTGNGSTDISSMSATERVERYKAEMRKKRFH